MKYIKVENLFFFYFTLCFLDCTYSLGPIGACFGLLRFFSTWIPCTLCVRVDVSLKPDDNIKRYVFSFNFKILLTLMAEGNLNTRLPKLRAFKYASFVWRGRSQRCNTQHALVYVRRDAHGRLCTRSRFVHRVSGLDLEPRTITDAKTMSHVSASSPRPYLTGRHFFAIIPRETPSPDFDLFPSTEGTARKESRV